MFGSVNASACLLKKWRFISFYKLFLFIIIGISISSCQSSESEYKIDPSINSSNSNQSKLYPRANLRTIDIKDRKVLYKLDYNTGVNVGDRIGADQPSIDRVIVEIDKIGVEEFSVDNLKEDCLGASAVNCFEFGIFSLLVSKQQKDVGSVDDTNYEGLVKETYQLFARACENGDPRGCYEIGKGYRSGTILTQDSAKAVEIFQQLCGAEALGACVELGNAYQFGRGVEKDLVKAASLYEQSCKESSMSACVNYGSLLASGSGVEQDYAMAARVFEMACIDGLAAACGKLGILIEGGLGVEQDVKKAATLYEAACKAGVELACNELARLKQRLGSSPS